MIILEFYSKLKLYNWRVDKWRDCWYDEYIKPLNIRTGTKEEYDRLSKLAIESFKDKKMSAVTPDDVYKYLLQRVSQKLADSTIKKDFFVLNQLFKKAYFKRIIVANPCDFVEIPKGAGIVRSPRVGGKSEIIEFLKVAQEDKNPITYPAILLLFSTGMRRSELLGLQWSDINFDDQIISVKRALRVSKEDGVKATGTKTAAGTRDIAVGEKVIMELLKLKKERYNPPYVFTTTSGTPFHPRNFSKIYQRIEEQSNAKISLHGARHSIATILAESNATASELAGMLGHSSGAFSLARYVHPSKKANRKLSNIIASTI